MLEQLILGIIQGIVEWLPVSSEGTILLSKKLLFHSQDSFSKMIQQALFLHLGTFFAALIYFFKDVKALCLALPRFSSQPEETKKTLLFLITSTLISGVFGYSLIRWINTVATQFDSNGKLITLLIGLLLLGTGFLECKAKKSGYKQIKDLSLGDGILLGLVQGLAALPGFSRSGLTVSALLLRKYDKAPALKLSFLMSLPIVLGGNILLHLKEMTFETVSLVGLGASFIFGFLTIHLLLKIAEKINFGLFVILFGLLTIASTLL